MHVQKVTFGAVSLGTREPRAVLCVPQSRAGPGRVAGAESQGLPSGSGARDHGVLGISLWQTRLKSNKHGEPRAAPTTVEVSTSPALVAPAPSCDVKLVERFA